ncbi:hypothetical protein HNR32_001836 [Pectinatus brassicae]|uniref:Uncharacterized protein n=1 Tax=Pectinatus brassicae TaxID=862415 RepID=A0A840UW85_9FIRM|nr:hypothetical protein [Pectinatus brassicae]MBB5336685.1 hypothetical protein [Pectinatus brassicae]
MGCCLSRAGSKSVSKYKAAGPTAARTNKCTSSTIAKNEQGKWRIGIAKGTAQFLNS